MANEAQAELWDDVVGAAWVDHAASYDELLEPFGRAAMDALGPTRGDRLIDLGCGTGATTVALARRVAPGEVVGVDLSTRMLAAARDRAAAQGVATATFRHADVQTADLGASSFDGAFSRMGVMFFADPVAAFANVAAALRPGGRLAFSCFQDLAANPGIVLPVLASAEILELVPPADPNLPGPFSLADAAHTSETLERAGFVEVEVAVGPDHVELVVDGDLEMAAERALVQNPLTSLRYTAVDDATRAAARAAVVAVFEPLRHGDRLRIELGTWIVHARTPT